MVFFFEIFFKSLSTVGLLCLGFGVFCVGSVGLEELDVVKVPELLASVTTCKGALGGEANIDSLLLLTPEAAKEQTLIEEKRVRELSSFQSPIHSDAFHT